MIYALTCPRCGDEFTGENRDDVADAVIEHARATHQHHLDAQIVVAHLEGVRPDDHD